MMKVFGDAIGHIDRSGGATVAVQSVWGSVCVRVCVGVVVGLVRAGETSLPTQPAEPGLLTDQ